jgi:hypothetical protein
MAWYYDFNLTSTINFGRQSTGADHFADGGEPDAKWKVAIVAF